MKAYTTRVGAGPFPTELVDEVGDKLRSAGHEYGTTTGRPRRCGWLDIMAMRYTHRINNFTTLNLTKLDVLSDLQEVKLGVAYKYNGKVLDSYPSSLEVLSQCTVEYETFPGWMTDISKARFFEDLPPACLTYIERIEELTGCNIGWVRFDFRLAENNQLLFRWAWVLDARRWQFASHNYLLQHNKILTK